MEKSKFKTFAILLSYSFNAEWATSHFQNSTDWPELGICATAHRHPQNNLWIHLKLVIIDDFMKKILFKLDRTHLL